MKEVRTSCDIPTERITEIANFFATCISNTFNDCLNNYIFPEILKHTKVMPVYRKDCRQIFQNYIFISPKRYE